ncbi:MAG TPA: DUF3501 family protein [Candidatus Binataceae bacterium]|nr:DUF3501 family protein [Candidatus Binataceae bacterium]
MKPISSGEILALADYERVRARLRPLFIHEKDHRRLAVGSHLTLLFENAQTVWYQVQEMIRTEKLEAPDAIAHELETYNELLPGRNEPAATMLLEYPEPAERDAALRRLVGLENHLWIAIGERRERGVFDTRQMSGMSASARCNLCGSRLVTSIGSNGSRSPARARSRSKRIIRAWRRGRQSAVIWRVPWPKISAETDLTTKAQRH